MRITVASMVLLAAIAVGAALPGCDAKTAGRASGPTAASAEAQSERGDGKEGARGSPGIRALAGGAYIGVVKVRVLPPEGSDARATSRNGTGSAELQDSGRLVVVGDIDQEADAGFAADGGFAGGGWSGGSDGVTLRIEPDGAISGGGEAGGNAMTIEGSIDRRRLDLFFEIELLADSGGGFPAGTRFQFRYDLWRPFERAPGQGGRTPKGGCREVVYRNKLVPNLSGGAMGMVRVPECRR